MDKAVWDKLNADTIEVASERLYLRHNFTHEKTGHQRINVLKMYVKEGGLQLFIDNGKDRMGRPNYAGIRLNRGMIKQLMEFVQLHEKDVK